MSEDTAEPFDTTSEGDGLPLNPTQEQQWLALQRGYGRARLWADAGKLDPELLIKACLIDHRYDQQVEDLRTDWLWSVVKASNLTKALGDAILAKEAAGDELCWQVTELAILLARDGSEQFRQWVRRGVDAQPHDGFLTVLQEGLIRLDGEPAVLKVAAIWGRWLQDNPESEDDSARELVEFVDDWFEASVGRSMLAASDDPDIQRFVDASDRSVTAFALQQANARQSVADSFTVTAEPDGNAVVAKAAEPGASCFRLKRWGLKASETDLQTVEAAIRSESRPEVLRRLLAVFEEVDAPDLIDRLLELCDHPDLDVRWAALTAGGRNADDRVRQFALRRLRPRGGPDSGAVSEALQLLVLSAQSGDEVAILQAAVSDNVDVSHNWFLTIIQIWGANDQLDARQLALACYQATPCPLCRRHAVEELQRLNAVPSWMRAEAQFDVDELTRQAVTPTEDR